MTEANGKFVSKLQQLKYEFNCICIRDEELVTTPALVTDDNYEVTVSRVTKDW